MKAFVFSIVSLAASLAVAFPAVNDKIVFKGMVEGAAGGQIDFTQTLELIAMDSATGKAKVTNTFALTNGQVQTQEVELAISDLLTSEAVADILKNCATYGGALGQTTVPEGTHQACQIPQQNGGTIFIADVPFGFIKQVGFDDDQNKITTEMMSFTNGK